MHCDGLCCQPTLQDLSFTLFEWLGSRVVSVLDSGAEGPGFKSQSRCCREQSYATVHTHRASVHQAAKLVAVLLRVAWVTAGLAESNGSLPSGLWLKSPAACRLTAKNRDQLRNLRPMSHLRFCRATLSHECAILSRDKVARQNRRCDIALTLGNLFDLAVDC